MGLSFNKQLAVMFVAICIITLAGALILQGALLYVAAFLGVIAVTILAFFYPSLVLALLIIATVLQEIFFVSSFEVATLNQIVGLMLLSVVIIRTLAERRLNKVNHVVTVSLVLLCAVLLSSFWLLSIGHDNPLQDINQYFRSLIYFFICLLVVRDAKSLALVLGAYIIAGVAVASTGFFWRAILVPIDYMSHGRMGIEGIAAQYIDYAMRCMIPLPIALFLFIKRKLVEKKYHLPLMAAVLVLSLAALLSGSRGAVLAYFFMVCLFALMSNVSIPKKVAFSAALLIIPVTLPISDLINSLMLLVRGQMPGDFSTNMRMTFVKEIFSGMKEFDFGSFLWGRGLENFRDYYSGFLNPPHSMWLQSFYELGIIGLGIQLFVLFVVAKTFLKVVGMTIPDRRTQIAHALTVGCGISIFVLFFWGLYENVGLINGSKHLFILLGTFIAGSRIVLPKKAR